MKIFSLFICLLMISLSAQAQRIERMYHKFLEHNHDLEQRITRTSITDLELQEAKMLYFPTLSATVGVNSSAREDYTKGDLTAREYQNGLYGNIELSQALFDKKLLLNIAQARINRASSRFVLHKFRQELALNFLTSYLNILSARVKFVFNQKKYQIARAIELKTRELKLDRITARFASSKRLDYHVGYKRILAQYYQLLNTFSAQVWHEEADFKQKIKNLYYPVTDYDYLDNMREGDEGRIQHKIEAVSDALNYSPLIRIAGQRISSAREGQKYARWPNISFSLVAGAGSGFGRTRDDYVANDSYNSHHGEAYVGLQGRWEWGFNRRYEKQRHALLVKEARVSLDEVIHGVKTRVRGKVIDLYFNGYYIYRLQNTPNTEFDEPSEVDFAREEFEELQNVDNYIDKETTVADLQAYLGRLNSSLNILSKHTDNKMTILSSEIELENATGKLDPNELFKRFGHILNNKMPAYEYNNDVPFK